MKNRALFVVALIVAQIPAMAQYLNPAPLADEMFFISDTQQPMWVETILLRRNRNTEATASMFNTIIKEKPKTLFMLGDIVSLGFATNKWKKVDKFLDTCRHQGTQVYGLLGNHDVMGRKKKGEQNFQKRFPENVRTGYVTVTDSVAVVMLNSNFGTLNATDQKKQQTWYASTLNMLDANDSIKAVIVCCHHAPFTNSKVVGCSKSVQQQFVPAYIASKKAKLFITGHSHNFEHFKIQKKDFLVIGGGGGLHQPLGAAPDEMQDLANKYKPMYHYLSVKRNDDNLIVTSHFLKDDFLTCENGMCFNTHPDDHNLASQQENVPISNGN